MRALAADCGKLPLHVAGASTLRPEDDAEAEGGAEDGELCEDGEDATLGCEHECRVVRGQAVCRCYPGYHLAAGNRCTGLYLFVAV